MKPIASLILMVLITLTPLSLFAEPETAPGRQALVLTAYREMPGLVNFLSESSEFQKQLDAVERIQLQKILSITFAFPEPKLYGEWDGVGQNPSRDGKFPKIEFSSDPSIFKLNPGEEERSAVTSEPLQAPIYFNLRYLNSKVLEPSYMEIVQILLHEIGHKIKPGQKDQKAIDSLAAKAIQFLKPYYHKVIVSDWIKLESLSLPENFHPSQFTPRNRTLVLSQANGYVEVHQLAVDRIAQSFNQYNGLGANIEEDLTVRILNLRDNGSRVDPTDLSFGFDYDLEIQSRLVYTDPNVGFRGSTVVFDGKQTMIPIITKHSILETPTTYLKSSSRIGVPEPRFYNRNAVNYVSVDSQGAALRDFSNSNRVSSVQKLPGRLIVQVSNPQTIRKVFLRVESPDGEALIKGTKPSSDSKPGQYQFEISPHLKSSSGEIRMSDLIINGDGTIPLPEMISLPVVKSKTQTPVTIKEVRLFDGTSWRENKSSQIVQLPDGPVRFRIKVESEEPLLQVRLLWNKGASLHLRNQDKPFGVYADLEEEVIQSLQFVEKTAQNESIYEFLSQEALQIELPTAKIEGITFRDSQQRFLNRIEVATPSLQSRGRYFRGERMLFTGEHLKVGKSFSAARSCQSAHSSQN